MNFDCNSSFYQHDMKNKSEIIQNRNMSNQYYKTETNNYARLYITRPNINYKKALFGVVFNLILINILSVALALFGEYALNVGFAIGYIVSALTLALLIIGFMLDKILIWFVKVYQSKAKIETRLRCCSEPSCSDYSILAIQKYGAIKGLIKAIKRIKRCHPPGSVDYP